MRLGVRITSVYLNGKGCVLRTMDNHHLPLGASYWKWFRGSVFCLLLCAFMAGCQFAQSPFARSATNAGGEFAAAAVTLSYLHEGKLSLFYARASFDDFRAALDGLDQQLPSQAGKPDETLFNHLVSLYKAAIPGVDHPCLETSCAWQTQVILLQKASKAFLQAGEQ